MCSLAAFPWCANDDVVIVTQKAIAVYLNQDGGIVIRQEGDQFDDDIVIIARSNLAQLIEALQAQLMEGEVRR